MTLATPEGTRRFEARAGLAPGAFVDGPRGVRLSSLGLGTYLGEPDDATDALYEAAIARALARGVNVLDCAINYLCQRSERTVGRALAAAFAGGAAARDEIVVTSKVGFVAYDGVMPANRAAWVHETYVKPGIFDAGEVVGGHHVLGAGYARWAVARSLENLGLRAIDVYFLHNPEVQLEAVPRPTFFARIRAAIEVLEAACDDGRVGAWGVATWDGLRSAPDDPRHLSLEDVARVAREVAGERHHFGAVELPYNLAMPQAWTRATQLVAGERVSAFEAARRLRLSTFVSAPLHEARLLERRYPDAFAAAMPGLVTDAARLLQFVRSTPGVGAALVGSKLAAHVDANTEVLRVPRLDAAGLAAARRALATRP